MDRFLTLQFYFTPRPDPNFLYTKFTLGLALLLLAGGLVLYFFRKRTVQDPIWKKILRPYPRLLFNDGLILLLLLLFRETGIPYLSMRIWWVLLGAFFLYSLLKFSFGAQKKYKRRAQKLNLNSTLKQYLPKKK